MLVLRLILVAAAVAFTALIVYAAANADFWTSVTAIPRNPWGLVTLVDLYLGFALFAVVIAGFDGRSLATYAWIAGLVILGNGVAAVWLALRAPRLVAALRAGRSVSAA